MFLIFVYFNKQIKQKIIVL